MINGVFYFNQYSRLFEADQQEEEVQEIESQPDTKEKATEESPEPKTYAVGDIVEYKSRKYDESKNADEQSEGAIAKGEIKKVIRGGKKYRIYNKNIDREFTKFGKDILKKSTSSDDESDSSSVATIGEETLLEKIYSNRVHKFGTI